MDNNSVMAKNYIVIKENIEKLTNDINIADDNNKKLSRMAVYANTLEARIKYMSGYPEPSIYYDRKEVFLCLKALYAILAVKSSYEYTPENITNDLITDLMSFIDVVNNLLLKYFNPETKESISDYYDEVDKKIASIKKAYDVSVPESDLLIMDDKELFKKIDDVYNEIKGVDYSEDENIILTIILKGDYFSTLASQLIILNNPFQEISHDARSVTRRALSLVPFNIRQAIRFNQKLRNEFVHTELYINKKTYDAYKENINIVYFWLNQHYNRLDKDKIYKLQEENENLKQLNEQQNKKLEDNLSLLYQLLENQQKIIETQKTQIQNQESMMIQLDDIKNELNALSKSLQESKEMIQPVLESGNSETIEQVISKFQDQAIAKIADVVKGHATAKTYSKYKDELEIILGKECFDKLAHESIDFIITAKTMYDNLSAMEGDFDYSGICLLLTKALERECKSRFYFGYKSYMKTQYGENPNRYPLWFIKEIRGKEMLLPENSFTLGSVAFATGFKRNHEDTSDLYLTMNDYCEDELFVNSNKDHVKNTLNKIGKEVDVVTNSYRNPAAHINPMAKIKATECFDYLINVEKLLQLILNECKY